MFCVILTVVFFLFVANEGIPKPYYAEEFYSVWNWSMRFPTNDITDQGIFIWAKNEYAMFYNATALNWRQLLINNTVYNWYPATKYCYKWSVDFELIDHYFDNTTYVGDTYEYLLNNTLSRYLVYVGSLNTYNVFGTDQTFIIHTDTNGLFGKKYIAANALTSDTTGQPGSEVLDLISMEYTLPPNSSSMFILPNYCKNTTNTSEMQPGNKSKQEQVFDLAGIVAIVIGSVVLLLAIIIGYKLYISKKEKTLKLKINTKKSGSSNVQGYQAM